ncbi:hypothetical protein IFM89_014838 [Coptis chinensis]|uniref:K Homology domain-containing protein n=1 Tax=Coptis chinensis TaxID=261450 RepID=A0A835IDZ7_9MAGN|nr:hypothetical protein IFM89_014838 [Coptis chinensis]
MAEELQYSSKRKYEDSTTPPPPTSSGPRRPTGFSAPISPPDNNNNKSSSYNNVPPPAMDQFQLAKQRAQEIASRLYNNTTEPKRPRTESNGSDDSNPNDYGSGYHQASSALPVPYGFQGGTANGSSKKIEIPNGRVGVIIGKGGETIKYLQSQSGGAKIQVTRDMDADPHSLTRLVEIMGTSDQISKAEQLIQEVLAEAESGGSGLVSKRFTGQPGAEQFSMKVPNNKAHYYLFLFYFCLVVLTVQSLTLFGSRLGWSSAKEAKLLRACKLSQELVFRFVFYYNPLCTSFLIPLHLPPGDLSTERTVYIDGTEQQIEYAKQLVNEVISEVCLQVLVICS